MLATLCALVLSATPTASLSTAEPSARLIPQRVSVPWVEQAPVGDPLAGRVHTPEVAAAGLGLMVFDGISVLYGAGASMALSGKLGGGPLVGFGYVAVYALPVLWLVGSPLAAALGAHLAAPPGEPAGGMRRSVLFAAGANLLWAGLVGAGSAAAHFMLPDGATTWPLMVMALALRYAGIGAVASWGLHFGPPHMPSDDDALQADLRTRRPQPSWRVSPTDVALGAGRGSAAPLWAMAF